MATGRSTTQQFNIATAQAARNVARLQAQLSNYNRTLRNIQQSQRQLNSQNRQIISSLNQQAQASRVAANNTQQLSRSFNLINTAGKIFVGLALHRTFLRLSQALIEATDNAIEFNLRINEIRTISDRNIGTVERWREQLRGLSAEFGIDVLDAAEAAYESLSNQVATAGNVQSFLREQIRLSIIGVGSLEDAVNATSSILNAYNLETTRAREVNDLLFAAIDRGRFRLDDLSDSLGRVTPLSRELGISYEETLASLSLLTRQGITYSESITFLRAVMLALIKPSKDLTETFRQWGVTSGQAAINTFGFFETVQRLFREAESGGDTLQTLAQQFTRVRAVMGELALASQDTDQELRLLRESAAQAGEAFEDSIGGLGRRARIQQQQVAQELNRIGERILEFTVDTVDAIGGARQAFNDLTTVLTVVTQGVVAYTVATRGAAISTGLLAASLRIFTSIPGLIALLGTQLAVSSRRLADFNLELRATGQGVRDAFSKDSQNLVEDFNDRTKELFDTFRGQGSSLSRETNQLIAQARANNNALEQDTEAVLRNLNRSLSENLKDPISEITDRLKELRSEIRRIDSDVAGRQSNIADRALEIQELQVRQQALGLPEEEELRRLLELRVQLSARAEQEIRANRIDEAERLFDAELRLQNELINRVQRDFERASELINVRQRRPEFDPFSRRGFRVRNQVVGQQQRDAEAAKNNASQLNDLLNDRINLLQRQNQLTEEFNQREEKRRQALQREQATRERGLQELERLLVIRERLTSTQGFGRFRADTRQAARAAGLSPEAQLQIVVDNEKRFTALRRAEEQQRTANQLAEIQKRANAEQELFQTRLKNQEDLRRGQEALARETAEELIGQSAILKSFADSIRVLPGIGGVTAGTTQRQAQDVENFRNTILDFQRAVSSARIDNILTEEELRGLRDRFNILQRLLSRVLEHPLIQQRELLNIFGFSVRDPFAARVPDFQPVGSAFRGIERTLNNVNKENSNLIDNMRSLTGVINALGQSLRRVNNAAQVIINRQQGVVGRPGFAFGSVGTDFIPALLGRGETVLTSSASRRIAPLLGALNSAAPSFNPEGNTFNFGNINITTPPGTTNQQIEAIAQGLERRVRMNLGRK